MSRKNDFVMQPLQKKLNRQNIISRLERVESRRLAPSARVGTLAELTQATGDLIVIGAVKIVDPGTGATNITIDPSGLTMANSANLFAFHDPDGIASIFIYGSTDGYLRLQNNFASGGIWGTITLTGLGTPSFYWKEDPLNTNTAQLVLDLGSNGTNFTVGGGENVIWAGKDGKETVFNEGSFDIDHRWEGANNDNLLKLNGGLDAVGIGRDASSDYLVSVAGSINLDSGNNFYINGSPVSGAITEIYHGTATTDTGTIINFYPPGNLPSGYDTFMVRVSLRADRAATAEGALLQLNNQSSSDYSNYVMWHNFDNQFNDSAQSSSDTTSRPAILFANAANSPTNEFACYEIWFYDVSSTTKNKTWQVRGFQRATTANTQFFIYDSVGSWHPTTPAALTNISIETQNGSNWIAGCEWWLYAA